MPDERVGLVAKGSSTIAAAAAAMGITSWSDASHAAAILAAFAAAAYNLSLLMRLWWRTVLRPLAERQGWLQPGAPKPRRRRTSALADTEAQELQ